MTRIGMKKNFVGLSKNAIVALLILAVALTVYGTAQAATVSHSPSEIVPQGAGSGLDADLLQELSLAEVLTKWFDRGTSLPICDSSIRGKHYLRLGGLGVIDTPYICIKKANGNYEWSAYGLVTAAVTPCINPGQCASGFCVDGYCCNTACAVACQSCNAAGNLGICTNLPAGTVDSCSGAYTCSGVITRLRNVCNGAGACQTLDAFASDCTGECDSQCSGGICVDDCDPCEGNTECGECGNPECEDPCEGNTNCGECGNPPENSCGTCGPPPCEPDCFEFPFDCCVDECCEISGSSCP